MITADTLRKLALSFPGTSEESHFVKTSFRVHKKIFATYDAKTNQACIKLSEIDQDVFSAFDRSIIFQVPNKWGKQGATFIDLNKVPLKLLKDALTTSYCEVAPAKLAVQVSPSAEE